MAPQLLPCYIYDKKTIKSTAAFQRKRTKVFGGYFDLSPEGLRAVLPNINIQWTSYYWLNPPQGPLTLTRLQNEFSNTGLSGVVNTAIGNLDSALPQDPPAGDADRQTAARTHGLDDTGYHVQNKRPPRPPSPEIYDLEVRPLPK